MACIHCDSSYNYRTNDNRYTRFSSYNRFNNGRYDRFGNRYYDSYYDDFAELRNGRCNNRCW